MTALQQHIPSPLTPNATGARMIQLMGWKWFWCAMNVAEITVTIEQVYVGEMWKAFHSPTFANDQRVRKLELLDDGSYRAQVQLSPNSQQCTDVVLSAGTTLTCFIPT